MPQTVLETRGLVKRFGSLTAVHELSLEVYEGEVFGFLGPNGAGKTTSIHMMCGLSAPDAGQVTIRGKPIVGGGADVRARVGVCPQSIVVWPRLRCLEQLEFIGQMYGVPASEARSRGAKLLEELGLSEKSGEQARNLSGGMQRRLNIAMALVHDPEIIVLDEPEAGLDPQSRVKVRDFILSMARKKTVIVTTHNMDEADRVADRVAIIDHGKLLVLDTPEALRRKVGEGDVVEIGLAGDGEVGLQAKEALGDRVRDASMDPARGVLTVRALDAVGALASILGALAQAGLKPGEVRVRENTLEDVFIQLTGRSLRE
ncbi:MAG: ABC transporter ATP-binding protein [Deltaproteobacteria bacterium]|nr:ABC transporter ATP-binding protein [Deltaproteobacteria bacterium]